MVSQAKGRFGGVGSCLVAVRVSFRVFLPRVTMIAAAAQGLLGCCAPPHATSLHVAA